MKEERLQPQRLAGIAAALAATCAGAISSQADAANAVTEWNALSTELLATYPSALYETRIFSIQHAAMHDALNTIQPRYQRYTDCDGVGGPVPGASVDAAVAEASYRTLVPLWQANVQANPPLAPPEVQEAVQQAIEARYQQALQAIPDGTAKEVGRTIGAACAAANLAKREDDGHDRAGPPFGAEPVYVPGNEPGDYQFTPPFDAIGLAAGPAWGDVTPFGIKRVKHRARPPRPLRSIAYAADLNYTKAIGRIDSTLRTPEQTEMAHFWYELSPSGWNRIASVVIEQKGVEPWDAARILTLVNFALADGYIVGFDAKYHYVFWRPITAIRAAANDGNPFTHPDPDWTSLCESPPVPDHPSTHTVLGAAAAQVLISYFGDRTAFATTSASLPGVTRHYRSFTHAAVENGLSRIYCGIHFVNAVTEGYRVGEGIGREVAKLLPPVKHPPGKNPPGKNPPGKNPPGKKK